jgi:hypothetical protein
VLSLRAWNELELAREVRLRAVWRQRLEQHPWDAVKYGVWELETRREQWRLTNRRGWIEDWLIPDGWEELAPLRSAK